MRVAFADTSFYQGLLNPRDAWHEAALTLASDFRGKVVTSEYVLCELGALMSAPGLRKLFLEFVHTLYDAVEVEVVPASSELFKAGLELFAKRPDKEWSLTDCISFALMHAHTIEDALTSDHHFEQAGFLRLLR